MKNYLYINVFNLVLCPMQAAEAQEALEKESLAKVETEVREELAQTLQGNDVSVALFKLPQC